MDIWVEHNNKDFKEFRRWMKNIGIITIRYVGDGYDEKSLFFVTNYRHGNLKKFQIMELLSHNKMTPANYVKQHFDLTVVQNYWDGKSLWCYHYQETTTFAIIGVNPLKETTDSTKINQRKSKYINRGYENFDKDWVP